MTPLYCLSLGLRAVTWKRLYKCKLLVLSAAQLDCLDSTIDVSFQCMFVSVYIWLIECCLTYSLPILKFAFAALLRLFNNTCSHC